MAQSIGRQRYPAGDSVQEVVMPSVRFPKGEGNLDQDEEWFEALVDGQWRRFRLHDYGKIFEVPGLYERVVYEGLECRSPQQLVELLRLVLQNWPLEPEELRVLDLGAGNGVVGECLRDLGVQQVVGLDILPEAKEAARRDRPEVYDDYVIADLTRPGPPIQSKLKQFESNCLTSVAALGFGDIPPRAFSTAFNAVSTPGWMAMTVHERFLSEGDQTGFARLVKRMIQEKVVHVEAQMRICHRKSISGKPLFYRGFVCRKTGSIPADWV